MMRGIRAWFFLWLAFSVCLCGALLFAQQKAESPRGAANAASGVRASSEPARTPDVIFVPTPQEAVDKMLELAEVKKGEKVYDLGCGDGRIVVTAAKKFGAKGVGIDIDPQRIAESQANVRSNKVEQLVTIKESDIFKEDFSDADVVTLYLLPSLNVKLIPQLEKLKPGARIISYQFNMDGVKPKETYNGGNGRYTIYKWVAPLEKENKAK
jgi:SAM-dependent methyltransferase